MDRHVAPLVAFLEEVEAGIRSASSRFDLAGRTLETFVDRNHEAISAAGARGVRIRFLIVDPESPFGRPEQHLARQAVAGLSDLALNLEVRYSLRPFVPRTARIDDHCIIELSPDAASPMRTSGEALGLRLTRKTYGGLLTQFNDAFERVWSEARLVPQVTAPWAEAVARLDNLLDRAAETQGREYATVGVQLESLLAELFGALPDFEVRVDMAGPDHGFDAIAFDTTVGEPILVQLKLTRAPVHAAVVRQSRAVAESLGTPLLLVTTSELSEGAREVLHQSWVGRRGRVSHLDLRDLARATSPAEARGQLLEALARGA
jgi:hypothetical protein